MAINFPNSPSVNDIHSEGGIRWKWNGSSWTRSGGSAITDTITTANDNSTTTLYPVMVTGTGSQTAKIATTATKNISFDASDGNLTIGGDVSIGGTVTYEDVKNVDSVGVITARAGIKVTGGRVGIGSEIPNSKLEVWNNANIEVLRLKDTHFNKYLTIRGGGTPNRMVIDSYEGGGGGAAIDLATNGTTRLRITSAGNVGIGEDNPDNNIHV